MELKESLNIAPRNPTWFRVSEEALFFMLILEISGHHARKKLTRSICEWFYTKFLSEHNITLEVNFRGLRREGVWGWCVSDDDKIIPESFLIEIHNRMEVDDYVKVLMHELVHVWQHARGDLIYKGQIALWKNIDYSDVDYENQPWEKMALKLEDELYTAYLYDDSYFNCERIRMIMED